MKIRQIQHTDILHKSFYTPHVRRYFLAVVGFSEIPVRYARKFLYEVSRNSFPDAVVYVNSKGSDETAYARNT